MLDVVLEGRVRLFSVAEVVVTSAAVAASKVEVHLVKCHVKGLRRELIERILMCRWGRHPSALISTDLRGLVPVIRLLLRLAGMPREGLVLRLLLVQLGEAASTVRVGLLLVAEQALHAA